MTLPISYVARLSVSEAGDVIAEARQFPRVWVRSSAKFERIGRTRITERMRIEAPNRWRASLYARGVQGAHRHAGGYPAPL
jgi:hypothetical protein